MPATHSLGACRPCFVLGCAVVTVWAYCGAAAASDISAILPGHYDNARQVADEAVTRPALPVSHLTLDIAQVPVPALGKTVFYAEWRGAADGRVTRQRLFQLTKVSRTAAVMNLYIWPPDPAFAERTRGAHLDPAKTAGLTAADFAGLPVCRIELRRSGRGWRGAMPRGQCRFTVGEPAAPIYSRTEYRLTPDGFSYRDGWFTLSGSEYRRFSTHWYRFERASAKMNP
jgi:CpeT/CpcT family (DUF1001)